MKATILNTNPLLIPFGTKVRMTRPKDGFTFEAFFAGYKTYKMGFIRDKFDLFPVFKAITKSGQMSNRNALSLSSLGYAELKEYELEILEFPKEGCLDNKILIEESYTKYKMTEDFIELLANRRISELLEGRDSIDLSELRDDDDYDLYGIGITLYDKHGFHETGLPVKVENREGRIHVTCNGTESYCNETLLLGELEIWSQTALVSLLENVFKDKNLHIGDDGKIEIIF